MSRLTLTQSVINCWELSKVQTDYGVRPSKELRIASYESVTFELLQKKVSLVKEAERDDIASKIFQLVHNAQQ